MVFLTLTIDDIKMLNPVQEFWTEKFLLFIMKKDDDLFMPCPSAQTKCFLSWAKSDLSKTK